MADSSEEYDSDCSDCEADSLESGSEDYEGWGRSEGRSPTTQRREFEENYYATHGSDDDDSEADDVD